MECLETLIHQVLLELPVQPQWLQGLVKSILIERRSKNVGQLAGSN